MSEMRDQCRKNVEETDKTSMRSSIVITEKPSIRA